MTATARFYLGFGITLAVIIALTFFIGFRVGVAHATHRTATAVTHAAP